MCAGEAFRLQRRGPKNHRRTEQNLPEQCGHSSRSSTPTVNGHDLNLPTRTQTLLRACLVNIDDKQGIRVECDASEVAVAATLSQNG